MTTRNAMILSAIAVSTVLAATSYQNQVGFISGAPKQIAVVDAAGQDVVFKDADGKTMLTVTAPEASMWKPANQEASLVDFSELTAPGTYYAFVGDDTIGHAIHVADNALEGVTFLYGS